MYVQNFASGAFDRNPASSHAEAPSAVVPMYRALQTVDLAFA